MKTSLRLLALLLLCGARGTGSALAAELDPDSLEFTPGVAVSQELAGVQSRFALDVSSLQVTTDRWQEWVDRGGGQQASVWKWTPRVDFVLRGPLAGRGYVFCDWYEPDGKRWLRSTFHTPAVPAGGFLRCATVREGMEPLASTRTGVFTVVLGLVKKGEPDVELFRGRVAIGRYHVGNNLPQFKDNYCYCVDNDWRLPLGWLYAPDLALATSGELLSALDESDLHFVCWFACAEERLQGLKPEVYCEGKPIVLPELAAPQIETLGTGAGWEGGDERAYTRCSVTYCGVVARANDPAGVDEPRRYALARHPGGYELRLVLRGQTVRRASFTVGADGKLVDPSPAAHEKLGTPRLLVPVAVAGTVDRPWNQQTAPAAAFWGNPLPSP